MQKLLGTTKNGTRVYSYEPQTTPRPATQAQLDAATRNVFARIVAGQDRITAIREASMDLGIPAEEITRNLNDAR